MGERSPADLAMDRYAMGEDAAFAEVYDALAPKLYGFLVRLTGDAATAEDVLQLTMFRIHEMRGMFVPGSPVVPWSIAIARHLAVDTHRRRRREALGSSDATERNVPSSDPSAEAWAMAGETAERLRAQLDKLPETQRTAFQLLRQEGLTLADAAAVLGTTVASVKLRAHRAYQALRAVLEVESGGKP